MVVAIAGKNNIAIDVTIALLNIISKNELFVIVNKNDTAVNAFQKSFLKFALANRLKIAILEEIYEIEDLVFLSLEFDRIIKPSLFRTNRLYNIHFSLLPAYKGMYTSAWPLLNGETITGVTLHEIDSGIDTGRVVNQKKIYIESTDTAKDIYFKYIREGTDLVIQNLTAILDRTCASKPQSSINSTYYSKGSISYNNIKINLNVTAYQIVNQLRAFTFRDYQLPIVNGIKVSGYKILHAKSIGKVGTVVEEEASYIIINSIDYQVKLYKDFYEEFWEACRINDLMFIKYCIAFIPNLEEKNKFGWNALIIAVYNNSIDVANYLLEWGADVNASNYNDTSVIMYAKAAAINHNLFTILDVVLNYTPNILHVDCYGKNVLQYAWDENKEVYNYLKNYL